MAVDDKGTGVTRKPRRSRVAEVSDTPFSDQASDTRGALAVWAYRLSLCGLLPGVGLLLGPVALVLGLIAALSSWRKLGFKSGSLCIAAIVLGLLTTLTQWWGLSLMIRGLQGD
jgi:hypothetical protein